MLEECRGSNQWIIRKYPTLEYFGFVPSENESIQGISLLLEVNPNIREFMTTAKFLLENRDKFTSSSVKLDDLAIWMVGSDSSELKSICDLLNKLHESDFYKRLKLNFMDVINQEMINQSATAKGLVELHVEVDCWIALTLSTLENLEELYMVKSKFIAEIEMFANELTHLRSIHFFIASITDIVPFIERSPTIQIIKVDWLKGAPLDGELCLRGEEHFDEKTQIIDLRALNKERQLLPVARKITVYVMEKIYLATKWAMNGNDFEKIRLRRLEY